METESGPWADIVVRDIRITEEDQHITLSCSVNTTTDDIPNRLWFQFGSHIRPYLANHMDPFYPILLLLAMRQRKRLVIESDLSLQLLLTSRTITEVYQDWSAGTSEPLSTIDVIAQPGSRNRTGRAAAAFFSGGVDSFYTVMRNQARYTTADARFISHVILVQGFDIDLGNNELFRIVESQAFAAAERLGKTLVVARTNARDFLRDVDWGLCGHGAAMAGVALAVGGLFHTVYIAGSLGGSETLTAWGSHPGVDPLWSNEQVELVHDAAGVTRTEKVRFLSAFPAILEFLRVCWENRDGKYNCGRCEKCLRTMIELHLYGGLRHAVRFPRELDLHAVDQLVIPRDDWKWRYWLGILRQVNVSGNGDLSQAIERVLARGKGERHHTRKVERALMRLVARSSVADRIRAVERLVANGAGVAIYRGLQDLRGRCNRRHLKAGTAGSATDER